MLKELQRQVVKSAPRLLHYPVKLIPFRLQKALLERLFSRLFSDALAEGEFDFLSDKWLKVEISDLGVCWFISKNQHGLTVAAQCAEQDVSFSGTLNDLILVIARKEDPDTLFFQRKLKIEGNTELGLEVKNIMDSVEFDALPALVKYSLMDIAALILNAQRESSPLASGQIKPAIR